MNISTVIIKIVLFEMIQNITMSLLTYSLKFFEILIFSIVSNLLKRQTIIFLTNGKSNLVNN